MPAMRFRYYPADSRRTPQPLGARRCAAEDYLEIPPGLGEYAAEQAGARGVDIPCGTTLRRRAGHAPAVLSDWPTESHEQPSSGRTGAPRNPLLAEVRPPARRLRVASRLTHIRVEGLQNVMAARRAPGSRTRRRRTRPASPHRKAPRSARPARLAKNLRGERSPYHTGCWPLGGLATRWRQASKKRRILPRWEGRPCRFRAVASSGPGRSPTERQGGTFGQAFDRKVEGQSLRRPEVVEGGGAEKLRSSGMFAAGRRASRQTTSARSDSGRPSNRNEHGLRCRSTRTPASCEHGFFDVDRRGAQC